MNVVDIQTRDEFVIQDRPTEFVQPPDISELTDEQIDVLLDGIRARRMQKFSLYKETMAAKEEAKTEKMKERLEKKLAQFNRALGVLQKNEEKLHTIANEVRGLRLQMGIDPMMGL